MKKWLSLKDLISLTNISISWYYHCADVTGGYAPNSEKEIKYKTGAKFIINDSHN